MLELIILAITVTVAISAYNRFDTLSPKLFIKELGHWLGFTVKSAPSIAKAGVETVKTANKAADLHVQQSGIEAKRGYNTGKESAEDLVTKHLDSYVRDEHRKQAILDKKIAKLKANQ